MFYKKILRPILFLLNPETIHKITFILFRFFPVFGYMFGFRNRRITNQRIAPVSLMGLNFKNPVGLAGGLDKNARALRFMKNMGFSFVEIGTVTPLAQKGNSKPRLFRLSRNQALINRMGFNNDGVEVICRRLKKKPRGLIVGGNIGKNSSTPNINAVEDFAICFEKLYPFVDYFTVNVSCPNIKDLSKLQNKTDLERILTRLMNSRARMVVKKPILLKISPDLSVNQLDEVVEVILGTHIDGVIATNTTTGRFNLDYSENEIARYGEGGLSGFPLYQISSDVIRYLRHRLGSELPIIGSGGVMSASDAQDKMDAGANLVQLYTGFIYEGPGLLTQILKSCQPPAWRN